jgi:polygalacturonase
VHVINCDVKCQDDACALFGSNKWVTVTNCTFSTRWSIFRFGGGQCENITISNCVVYDTFGSVVKMAGRANSRYENITFANLIMKNVTGPITIGLQSARRNTSNAPQSARATPPVKGIVRNIVFNGIRATVAAEGQQFPDMHWEQSYRDGERRTASRSRRRRRCPRTDQLHGCTRIYEGGTAAEARCETCRKRETFLKWDRGRPTLFAQCARLTL